MAKEHIFLALENFEELKQADFIPFDQLPIPEEEKDHLIKQATEKYGSPTLIECIYIPYVGVICIRARPNPQ